MTSFLHNAWGVVTELAPWLLLGALIAGLMHGLLPRGFVRKHLSGRGGVLKAVSLGVPLPLCSCGVIPAGLGLKEDGASDGSAIGFVTATPQTGVDSILVSASFLGWPFALWKVLAALVTGVVGGWITDAATGSEASCEIDPAEADMRRPGPRQMLDHGVEMIRMIWGWLLFGILASAALGTWLPTDAFSTLSTAGTLAAFGGALAISVPLYVCATASVPIAAALVGAGMPTGAAMVFLMAGPATNLATLGAVRRAFGGRVVMIYLATLVLGSVAFGLGYEALFGALSVGAVHAHEHAAAWWEQASGLALLLAMSWFAFDDLKNKLAGTKPPAEGEPIVIGVEGMTCGGCSSRLEKVLRNADGVESASVSLEGKRAEVIGAITPERVRELVTGAGFDPV